MKNVLLLLLAVLPALGAQAQHKKQKADPRKGILAPPPELPPSIATPKIRAADPWSLDQFPAFKTDTIYNKTDTAFQVECWYFIPVYAHTAQIKKEIAMYPASFSVDSLKPVNGTISLAREIDIYIQEGSFTSNAESIDESDQIVFTDDKTKKITRFRLTWKGKGEKRKIIMLTDEATKKQWRLDKAPPPSPGY